MKRIICVIILCFFLFFIYGKYINIKGLEVKEYEIASNKLTNGFDGIKIVQFSDILYYEKSDIKEIKPDNLKPEDKWILTKFEKMLHTTKKFMDKYQFNNASSVIYDFVWTSFCDSYIEMAKYSLSDCATKSTLCYILTNILKLLHPFMPYVTEEIYQMLPIKEEESIMISNYPKYSKK